MKKILLSSLIIICSANLFAQEDHQDKPRPLPSVDIKTLEGGNFSSSKFENGGKPFIISFWATWCKPCVNELNNITDLYDDWKAETGVKIIAVSIDDARNITKVAPFVNAKNWDYEVYIDPNGDLKRALNVNTVPHTFLVNGNNEIVWQHTSYVEGDEFKLYEEVKKIASSH